MYQFGRHLAINRCCLIAFSKLNVLDKIIQGTTVSHTATRLPRDKQVVVEDIKALLAGRPLPYQGFDMFEGEDHNIKGQVQIDG